MIEAITTNQAVIGMLSALALFSIWTTIMIVRSRISKRKLEELQIKRVRHFLTTHSKLLHERRELGNS